MSGASRLIVSAPSLASELADRPGPVLLDARWRLGGPPGIDSYRTGHLPGAVFVDLDRDLSGPPGPAGRHPLPDPAVFQAAMRGAGVSRDRPVVVYDDGDGLPAARGWWMLRYHGHRDVRVLDGGYRAWLAAGLPVTTAAVAPAPGDFAAQPGHMPVLDASAAGAMARGGLLLDARSAERYRGENEHVDPVAGHIPGAVSAPSAGNINPDGTFKSTTELAGRFASLGAGQGPAGADAAAAAEAADGADAAKAADGADGAPAVGAYCGSGVTAAHEVLALALAGLPAALYVGSWSDWITDPSRPVATGG